MSDFWIKIALYFNSKISEVEEGGGGGGGQFDSDFNLCFLERGWNPDPDFWCFLSYIFPEKLIKIQQIVWKIWKFSSSILAIFANFSDFLTFSCWRKKTNDVSI